MRPGTAALYEQLEEIKAERTHTLPSAQKTTSIPNRWIIWVGLGLGLGLPLGAGLALWGI